MKITTVSYQRNGISGNGFYVVQFKMHDGEKNRPMLATIDTSDLASTRAIALDELTEAWRGDCILDDLCKALGATTDTLESVLLDLAFPQLKQAVRP